MVTSDPVQLIFGAAFTLLVLAAAISDLRTLRIPNVLSLLLLLLFLLAVTIGARPIDWLPTLGISAAVFVVGLGAFACGWLGGGDVKLLTALTLWAGPAEAFDFLTVTALLGALLALLMVTKLRFIIAGVSDALGAAIIGERVLGIHLPYGIAIAAAAMLTIAPGLLTSIQ